MDGDERGHAWRPGALARAAFAAAALLAMVMETSAAAASRFFVSSDGVKLHYVERGTGSTLVFIPGWTMPAWVFDAQIAHFAREHRVIAFDPRSQGESAIAPGGHHPDRRARDIAELLVAAKVDAAVLAGWSLGVLDVLAYVRQHGDAKVTGLVLIDNSVGEEPPPDFKFDFIGALRKDRQGTTRNFVRAMYKRSQTDAYYERLARASLRVPLQAAVELLSYPYPRSYWREAIYGTRKPILYAVTPRWAEQGANLARKHPAARTEVFGEAGHALFVDEALRFNQLMSDFVRSLPRVSSN